MKKTILILAILLGAWTGQGHTQNTYEKGMQTALSQWGNNKSMEAIALLERISATEKGQWLPSYYISLISTIQVMSGKTQSNASLILNKAQKYHDQAEKISPNNAELICLQALVHTGWITLNPKVYGQKLSPVIIQLYKKAMEQEPENPRPIYLLAEYQIHMDKMFGKDPSIHYKMLTKSLEKFNTFKAPCAFYPSWGKDRVIKLLQRKNENK